LPILDPAKLLDCLAPRAGLPELYTINTLERQTRASVAIDDQRLLPAVANRAGQHWQLPSGEPTRE
jgi:hypothetical protein